MTSLLERPTPHSVNEHQANPVNLIRAEPGTYSMLEIAGAYAALGLRPIPLCDGEHRRVSAHHAEVCLSPGKAPLEKDYPRFATTEPSDGDLARMFARHRGNIGGVVAEGYIVLDIDPRSGGMESIAALTERYGPLPETPTGRSGGNGLHNYLVLPEGVNIPSGGSLAAAGYAGVEWKGAGQQVVLPPAVHASGRDYYWEPGYALGEVPLAPIPDWLLQLIQTQPRNDHGDDQPRRGRTGAVRYEVQSPRVQKHLAQLWDQVGVDVEPGSGDRFYSCPFHEEQHPSMHIDAERCIWNCLSPECRGHQGGGIRELELLVGPLPEGPLAAGLAMHRPVDSAGTIGEGASELGETYPNTDADDPDPLLEELKTRAKELFPQSPGVQPKVTTIYGVFKADPSRAVRQQVISNSWSHPANRTLKCRQHFVHLSHLFSSTGVEALYGISISPEEWTPAKREALAAQVKRRGGDYAAFDNRAVAGCVRLLTNVAIPGAEPVEDIEDALFEALRDVDLPEDTKSSQRMHLVWLSRGWALPAHEAKGTVATIGYQRDVAPVNDALEAAEARQLGLDTWSGSESDDLEQWGVPRYFAVPRETVDRIGPEGACDMLLELAQKLGYRVKREAKRQLFPEQPRARAA